MATTIIDFWKENHAYWITPPSKHKEVDAIIYDTFWIINLGAENLIGQIIYYDQFSRHFQRGGYMTEEEVVECRHEAIELIESRFDELAAMDETEIIFALMPFKHLKCYRFIFEYLHGVWLRGRKLIDLPLLQKFYMDSYKKAFTLETVKENLFTDHPDEPYNSSLICDSYPQKYCYEDWKPIVSAESDALVRLLKFDKKVIVSLSGGVDSMVMLTLLASARGMPNYTTDVEAVHIIYGNRAESEHEYMLLADYCERLGVKLTVYRIKWLRRGEIDRQFYEDMTRDLRFMVYKACSSEPEPTILLGHIKDDVVENIWTNIAYCHHLDNLKKMKAEEVQFGVRIMRPFLNAEKKDIYTMSERIGIPYLKNTTPSWSNRGKFREHFHKATVAQFGESIDIKIIKFAEAIQTQNNILNTLLYDPIYSSFKDNTINITTAVKVGLDANSWVGIFEHICHKHFDIPRPSIKCVQNFCERLVRMSSAGINVDMGKHFKVRVTANEDSQVIMEFLLLT